MGSDDPRPCRDTLGLSVGRKLYGSRGVAELSGRNSLSWILGVDTEDPITGFRYYKLTSLEEPTTLLISVSHCW